MDIRPLDLGDDRAMRAAFEAELAADRLGRETMPQWTLKEFVGGLRTEDPGERVEAAVALDDDRTVGVAISWYPRHDNLDKVYTQVHVDPAAARNGVGRALVTDIEDRARADGRRLVLNDAKIPADRREDHGYRRFAESCGYRLSNIEVVRHLPMPVPEERIRTWADAAAQRHQGYTIETHVDGFPEDLAESLCTLLGQLAVDAPTGEVDFEEEAFTVERLRARQELMDAMGRSVFETVALTPDRVVAAQTTLAVPRAGDTAFQWGTFVHREHRGHRLGLAVKAANLCAVQERFPAVVRAHTQNAETNDYMVSINAEMGFEPVEVVAEFIHAL